MSDPTLMAEPREVVGKKVKRLRREGKVPAVVYGPTLEETVQVSVSEKDFSKFFSQHGHATLFNLTCSGDAWPVFIREVQVDPVRRNPLHVDFFSPNLKKSIEQAVPLHLVNTPDGPGIFQTMLSDILVRGLPATIPNRIEVDCSNLEEIGDAVRVGDLSSIVNIEILTSEDDMIAMLSAHVVEEEPEEEIEGIEDIEYSDEEGEEGEVGIRRNPTTRSNSVLSQGVGEKTGLELFQPRLHDLSDAEAC